MKITSDQEKICQMFGNDPSVLALSDSADEAIEVEAGEVSLEEQVNKQFGRATEQVALASEMGDDVVAVAVEATPVTEDEAEMLRKKAIMAIERAERQNATAMKLRKLRMLRDKVNAAETAEAIRALFQNTSIALADLPEEEDEFDISEMDLDAILGPMEGAPVGEELLDEAVETPIEGAIEAGFGEEAVEELEEDVETMTFAETISSMKGKLETKLEEELPEADVKTAEELLVKLEELEASVTNAEDFLATIE